MEVDLLRKKKKKKKECYKFWLGPSQCAERFLQAFLQSG